MDIAIIGGGSLGLMWCARLIMAGITPMLIVRTEEQKELILREGLIYTESGKTRVLHPVVQSQMSYKGELSEWSLVTVKQTQLSELLPFLKAHINRKGYIISLQNGLGHIEKLAQIYSMERIILGSTSDGALRQLANQVERTGYGDTWIGLQGSENPSQSIIEVIERLELAGLKVQWDRDMMKRLWRKCIINSAINPMTAILNVENGRLLQSDTALSIMKQLFNEGCSVAKAYGFDFYEDLWQDIQIVCRNTSRNRSSMLQDVLGHRLTEIEYINGFISTQGVRVGIPTPLNQLMTQLIHSREELDRTSIY